MATMAKSNDRDLSSVKLVIQPSAIAIRTGHKVTIEDQLVDAGLYLNLG
jgi:hypothetical protein